MTTPTSSSSARSFRPAVLNVWLQEEFQFPNPNFHMHPAKWVNNIARRQQAHTATDVFLHLPLDRIQLII
ncbi:unnamed protein product [Caenorhabditis nigoni]